MVPVSHELYAALAFSGQSLNTLPSLFKASYQLSGWRAKLATFWLIFSTVFVVILPTMLDSATGYVLGEDPYIVEPQGSVLSFESFTRAVYPGNRSCLIEPFCPPWNEGSSCYTFSDNATYTDCTSTSAFHLYVGKLSCIPGSKYQWGFSSTWAIIFAWLCWAWLVGTYFIWLSALRNSRQRYAGRTLGTWTAVVDLADAIYGELGASVGWYTNSELERKLRSKPFIKYTVRENDGKLFVTLSSKEQGLTGHSRTD
ncbi:hypothetical protein LTS18_008625 [Coniosporium uncinatum]|uniref:Uncharacterized protein n=1 Tax=Coniosporium uncinatum TaxID=93489 RepID=A0ACC3D1S0_9PEZI|nr:hypothetical protein LTS18_008625 [Coniosporium uncinatum]